MSVRSGQSITVEFTTRRADTGSATNADSLPTGTLIVNGTDNAATVTVTNIATGRYKAAVTLPTLAVGDIIELNINATVNSVTDNAIIYRDTKDLVIDAAGLVDATAVKLGPSGSATAQTARDVGAQLDAAITTRASATVAPSWYTDVSSNVSAIKTKTDKLTFTVATCVDANIQYVNDVTVVGTGAVGNEWGP